jgi:hypothetical protein
MLKFLVSLRLDCARTMLLLMLAHHVYFTLKDASAAAENKLLAACREFLTNHPGTVFFACGTLADALKRDVNDRNFDVSLHIVFKDQAAHDAYQVAPRHLEFITQNRDNWKQVRVFDSLVECNP